MIIDTDKTNCGNCKLWVKSQTTKEVLDHPMMTDTTGVLMVCVGDNGCGITGDKFYCSNHEFSKKKGLK